MVGNKVNAYSKHHEEDGEDGRGKGGCGGCEQDGEVHAERMIHDDGQGGVCGRVQGCEGVMVGMVNLRERLAIGITSWRGSWTRTWP